MCEGLAVTGSELRGLQLSLGVINIPAVEFLACVRKHDKTASHLSSCSQRRLAFVWRGTDSTEEGKNKLMGHLSSH